MIICGREVSAQSIEWLNGQGVELSQRERARQLCQMSHWQGPSGQLSLASARHILVRLERDGVVKSCPAQEAKAPGVVGKPDACVPQSLSIEVAPLECSLEELGTVELVLVGAPGTKNFRIWKGLLNRYHYLGAGPLFGAQLRYLIGSKRGWIGAMSLSAAARRLESRDKWIGWGEEARRENLHLVINQSRFLIAQSVNVPNLASHVLNLAAQRIQCDWKERYGYEPVLLETFVEREHFDGASYLAANRQGIGISAGRGRQDRDRKEQLARKLFLVHPLEKNFRDKLCALPELRRLIHVPKSCPAPVPAPLDWAQEELACARLPNQRLRNRAMVLARDFFAKPQANIAQACGSLAKTKAAYRFFDHHWVSMQAVLSGHYEASARRAAKESVVLAVQDTTDLNYSTHRATQQLGPIGESELGQVGMLLHDTMLYNLQGTPLGLLDVQCWVRQDEGIGDDRRNLPIEQKESSKWLQSFAAASRLQSQCPQTQVVSMGDSEADVYELFVAARDDPHHTKLLVRVWQERRLEEGQCQFLREQMKTQEAVLSFKLKIPTNHKQSARTAVVDLRYGMVELKAPHRKRDLGPVKLWAVWVLEVDAPPGVKPVEWMLFTNVPVNSPQEALQKVDWYCQRFQIEVYHRTLKSGCRIEERQLGSAERIESSLGIDLLVAWRIVYLTKLGRETPQVPCTVFFEEAQWQALVFFTTGKPPPKEPPTLWMMILMVAQLGGFLGRKSDGQPGTQSMWLGLERLDDITEMWLRFKSLDPATVAKLMDSS